MPDQTGEPQQRGRRSRAWRGMGLRGLVGLTAVGATAAVVITATASAVPASAGTHPQGHANALTETTSSSAGNMTVKVSYTTGPRGRIKVGSVSYAGDSNKKVKSPVLTFMFGPAFPVPVSRGSKAPSIAEFKGPRTIHAVALAIVIRIKPSELKDFSGSLPARLFKGINRHGGLLGGETLTASLAHGQFAKKAKFRKQRKPINVIFQPVMQTGMILNPSL
jgi:hypothetical protein